MHSCKKQGLALKELVMVILAYIQGIYFVATGLFPLFSMRAFEAITGPKQDHWLVKTVGLLITVIGAVILYSAQRGEFPQETVILAVGSAGVLAAVDIFYSSIGRISKVYLLDAVAEILLILAWLWFWL